MTFIEISLHVELIMLVILILLLFCGVALAIT